MDEQFMRKALELANQAACEGEVPVGCVITLGDRIVGQGRNRRELGKTALAHAELEAIHEACQALEPCPMCAGAIINARIPRIVFGAKDSKAGSCGSVVDLFSLPYNHRPEVVSGVLEQECAQALSEFFSALRRRKRTQAQD